MYAKRNIPMHANKKHSSRGTCPTAIAMFKCNVVHVEKLNQWWLPNSRSSFFKTSMHTITMCIILDASQVTVHLIFKAKSEVWFLHVNHLWVISRIFLHTIKIIGTSTSLAWWARRLGRKLMHIGQANWQSMQEVSHSWGRQVIESISTDWLKGQFTGKTHISWEIDGLL